MESAGICAECNDHYGMSSDGKACGLINNCVEMRNHLICDICDTYFNLLYPKCNSNIANCDILSDADTCS